MANNGEKDLVYFKQGIPAGHQMDKYSANPGCLFSKNVDIFSSSNSYKATAFSTPDSQADGVVATDERGRFWLYSSGKVEDTKDGSSWNITSRFDYINSGAYVDYYGPEGTSSYSQLQLGTPKNIVVKYNGDEWQEIVVFTDRIMFTRSKVARDINFIDIQCNGCTAEIDSNGNIMIHDITLKKFRVSFNTDAPGFISDDFDVYYTNDDGSTGTINWWSGKSYYSTPYLYYDTPSDSMVLRESLTNPTYITPTPLSEGGWINVRSPMYNRSATPKRMMELDFELTTSDTVTSSNPRKGYMQLTNLTMVNEWYNVLPLVQDRTIKNIGEYYFIYNGGRFPSLWNFPSEWVTRRVSEGGTNHTKIVPLYTFTQYMGWEIDPASVAVDCVSFNERVYLICNQDGNGYIFPCDLSGGKGTPYIAYGVEFKAAIVLNYLIYLVGENRGVSTLFVYSGQELVHVIEGNEKNGSWDDRVNKSEQFKFNGMMADWRGKLILGTTDNRIFCYGQTYGGRGGAFIHKLADGQVLDSIRAIGKDLYIKYTENSVLKTIKYQDDTAIKNYNTEFEVVYPVILGNHIIEKEVYDLYCSYRLPSSDCSLQFRLSVNHNYFWSFLTDGNTTPEVGAEYTIYGCNGDYVLTFVEKIGNWLTFSLSGDLPYQALNNAVNKLVDTEQNEISYSEFNNFKLIREITTDNFKEGFYREENITAKLGLPRTHSLQLMVRGIGTANYTPEVFGVSLDSNQRNRG